MSKFLIRLRKFTMLALVVGAVFFMLGSITGYMKWNPQLKESRNHQALDSGLLFLPGSLVLDPLLYLKLFGDDSSKNKDGVP
jgi:hypothetical protein